MKKTIAAAVSAAAPLALLGFVGGFEAGRLSFWGMIALGAGCIWAEWWGLSIIDNDGE